MLKSINFERRYPMKKFFTKFKQSKRGSEIIQVLIVIALMGSLAIVAIKGLSDALHSKSVEIENNINSMDTLYNND